AMADEQLQGRDGREQRRFFFQAEDRIRGRNVTGAPTCALPIHPSKALVDGAPGRDVDTVMVDGKVLVQGGPTTRVNEDEVYAKARQATEQYWSHVDGWRWDGATVDRIVPPAFPMRRPA